MGRPAIRCLWCHLPIVGVVEKRDGTYWRHLDEFGPTHCEDGVTVADPAGIDDDPPVPTLRTGHGRAKCARSGCPAEACQAWRRGFAAGRVERERAA
jgi:hypothetical protein